MGLGLHPHEHLVDVPSLVEDELGLGGVAASARRLSPRALRPQRGRRLARGLQRLSPGLLARLAPAKIRSTRS